MNRLFNIDNGFFRLINKMVDCICLSLLFLLTCIPLITVGASLTALYYTVHKVIKNDRGYLSQEYFSSFKDNFKQSTIIWLILFAAGFLLYADARILIRLGDNGNALGNAFFFFEILIFFEVMWGVYIFSYMARFENTVKNIFKNAGFMAIIHLPRTFLIAVITIVFSLVIFIIPFALIIIPSIYCWFVSLLMEKTFRKYMSEEDRIAEDEINREYKN